MRECANSCVNLNSFEVNNVNNRSHRIYMGFMYRGDNIDEFPHPHPRHKHVQHKHTQTHIHVIIVGFVACSLGPDILDPSWSCYFRNHGDQCMFALYSMNEEWRTCWSIFCVIFEALLYCTSHVICNVTKPLRVKREIYSTFVARYWLINTLWIERHYQNCSVLLFGIVGK